MTNKEWDDIVTDTKEVVRVSMSTATPMVRRVSNKKKGTYVGTFDLKNAKDKVKYKSMFKAAK